MNKFGVALKILANELDIKKRKLEEEGKLCRTELNQSMKTKCAPRADKIDHYLKAFGVSWVKYAQVLMQVEANWDRLQVQPAQKEKITIDGREIDLDALSEEPAKEESKRNKVGPSIKKVAQRKHG